jgi:membrane protein YqaA with SNARE-associated domain
MVRRLYDWVMGWSESPYATPALFLIAFAESSFFPIPPDVLLMALAISAPRRAIYYALVCTAGSVTGGMAGYAIGYHAFEIAGKPIIEAYGIGEKFDLVGQQYQANAFAAIAIAGFTPIPYKVFTIAAGVFKIGLPTLVGASLVGRAGRFLLVGGLIRMFGPQIKSLIDKYFNLLSIAFVVLLVLGFFVIRMVGH